MWKNWADGPPGVKAWGKINANAGEGIAEVRIYDEIGIWGVDAQGFADEISALEAETLQVYVNSPGGDAYDGIAIMNALTRHKARVEITVDGLAASAASLICMAADKLVMNRGAQFMVHETWTFAGGSADDLRAAAVQLDKLSDSYADCYAKRAGGSREEWREAMKAETWYTAEEAVDAGLADEWVDADAEEVAARASAFDLKRYGYRGRRAAARADETPSASEPGTTKKGDEMALRDDLIERLGLSAEATDEEILEAIDAELEDNDDDPGEGGGESAAAQLPEGVTAISADVLAQLQADAAAGRQAAEAQASERREAALAAAVREGRITPAARATWLERMKADEAGTVALLETLAKGSAAPVAEIGHSDEPENADEALYASIFGSPEKAEEV